MKQSQSKDFENFLKFSTVNGIKWEQWQEKVAKSFFENRETFLICPRQNGKSELMIWISLFVFFIKNKSIYFSTHSQKSWRKLRNRINHEINSRPPLTEFLSTHLNGLIKSPITNKLTGATFIIDNRTETSATGDSYDYNFIDECQFLTDGELASLYPTMATRQPKVFYGGTSPAPKFNFFLNIWQHEKGQPNFFYYGIPDERAIPSKLTETKLLELVRKTNPNYPAFIKKDSIILEYKRLSRTDFIRERLGVIDYSTSNLFFDESKLSERTFKNREFKRAILGIYANGSKVSFTIADRDGDDFFIQPLGIYDATDSQILEYFIQRKNKIREIKVSGNDYAIYDRYTKALGTNKYNILKATQLYQRDAMVKDYYENNQLSIPENLESSSFLLDIQHETKKFQSGIVKDIFYSFNRESNIEFQSFANALFGANNLSPKQDSKPRHIYKVGGGA